MTPSRYQPPATKAHATPLSNGGKESVLGKGSIHLDVGVVGLLEEAEGRPALGVALDLARASRRKHVRKATQI